MHEAAALIAGVGNSDAQRTNSRQWRWLMCSPNKDYRLMILNEDGLVHLARGNGTPLFIYYIDGQYQPGPGPSQIRTEMSG